MADCLYVASFVYPLKMLLRDIVAGNFAEFMNKIHNVHANDFFA